MLMKRIEIHGFKSFAERTEFELGKGVTCLVGPNGCGKSNVVDAVKWALGEQRPTALRGDAMADVIFKGNGRRPAMGFAEVTLVFDNSNGELRVDMTEVAITRRLYKSGESEYLINRQGARLKDVRELFYDTGLGSNAYAVLEQGRIDAILQANAVDRRAIFEEAAGIHRFRVRKKEALRKLEKVDQNLLRVKDLQNELEGRVRSLRIQAGRAKSYVELSGRLTELRTVQYLRLATEFRERKAQLAQELETAHAADRESETHLGAASAAVEMADAEVSLLRDESARLQTEQAEARASLDAHAERLENARQRGAEAEQEIHTKTQQIDHLVAETERRASELSALEQSASAEEAERVAAEQRSVAAHEAAGRARAAEHEHARAVDAAAKDLDRCARTEVGLSNESAALESGARGLRQARERLVRREAELSILLERARGEAAELEHHQSRLDEEARQSSATLETARERQRLAVEREAQLRREIGETRARLAALTSRRDTLDGIIQNMEGVDAGVRQLLKAVKSDAALRGVRGLLAELVAAPRDRARAIDAALGSLASAIVVEDVDALRSALQFLRQHNGGAVQFLVLGSPSPARSGADDVGESLLSGLKPAAELETTLRAVLGHARLVDGEDALFAALGSGAFVVTRDGARLDACGAVSGRPSEKTLGFVERRAERDEVTLEAERVSTALVALEQDEARAGAECAEAAMLVREAEARRQEVQEGLFQNRSAGDRLRERAQHFQRELAVSASERLGVEREEQQARERRAQLDADLATVRAQREGLEAERARLAAAAEDTLRAAREAAAAAAAAAQDVVRCQERVRGLLAECAAIRRSVGERIEQRDRLAAERAAAQDRLARAHEVAAELRITIDQLHEKRAQLGVHLHELDQRRVLSQEALERARAAAHAAAAARETARERLHGLQMKEQEVELGLNGVRDRAREELNFDIDERLSGFDPTQAPPLEQVEEEARQVRDRISRLGNVNLDAIHELEEQEQRLAFILREQEDLDAARKSLEATIKELDNVSRAQFEETFNAVREHFQALFRKLFHGGRADVRLEEGQDILDAGVEIIAAPPGKEARSITLLSGGERTMTAVALLFSLFKAKPAPIAILDEVDAALDEANTERFCNLLADFIGTSQFLIVTHSKRTMSYADIIFGVTMEEPGCSKRIGIKIEEFEQVA
ncbi:MAG: chromosome segregation protein SMC [Planctomycetes bacterium]|nr:chromosome segregation protein SMC [Planctomycetota bacterium]